MAPFLLSLVGFYKLVSIIAFEVENIKPVKFSLLRAHM